MKKAMTTLALAMTMLTANAQESNVPAWINNVKLSGYGMVQYQALDKKNAEENSLQLRLVRVSLEGRADKDWYWKMQMQINGTPRLVDAFAEWQKYKFLQVKGGQFKRPFTFENPMHPITQGFMSYSQPVSKLAGFSDRTGEQASNGRDVGVQVQGDLLPIMEGQRALLHYQVGVFNGQGINVKDADNRKDIIGGLWVMPVKGMRIGAFGWSGSRGDMTYVAGVDNEGKKVKKTADVSKTRYALSADYQKDDWTFRTEYIHSKGFGSDVLTKAKRPSTEADGYYALCIAPVIKNKFHVKARYDVYREQATWKSSKTFYEVGADYLLNKNVQLNLEYARVNERTGNHNYNLVDLQMDFRF